MYDPCVSLSQSVSVCRWVLRPTVRRVRVRARCRRPPPLRAAVAGGAPPSPRPHAFLWPAAALVGTGRPLTTPPPSLQYNPFQLTDEVKALQARATEIQLKLGEWRGGTTRRWQGPETSVLYFLFHSSSFAVTAMLRFLN